MRSESFKLLSGKVSLKFVFSSTLTALTDFGGLTSGTSVNYNNTFKMNNAYLLICNYKLIVYIFMSTLPFLRLPI